MHIRLKTNQDFVQIIYDAKYISLQYYWQLSDPDLNSKTRRMWRTYEPAICLAFCSIDSVQGDGTKSHNNKLGKRD